MRHGILATRGGLAAVDKGEDGPPFTYFAHHPPLVPFGGAAAFLVLGVRDLDGPRLPGRVQVATSSCNAACQIDQCVL